VILKDTHPQVKFDVFERLNSGATKLTPQELRHGLYYGDLMSLATKAVKESSFLSALEIKNDKRMKAEELVLRFWALSEGYDKYRKPLATFINNYSDKNRKLTQKRKDSLLRSFVGTLDLVRGMLGELAFKVFNEELKVESNFNSALYDALMVGLYQVEQSGKLIKVSTGAAQKKLGALIEGDERFRRSISIATSDEAQVKYRIEAIRKGFSKRAE